VLKRGKRVILDSDIASLYGVPVKSLVRAVKRNVDRFPGDFMFQLEADEHARLRYQFGTSKGRGGRRYAAHVFTERGVAMLASVLRSKRAKRMNIELVRAFVELRRMLASDAVLARKLSDLEAKHDRELGAIFDAIRELVAGPDRNLKRRIHPAA